MACEVAKFEPLVESFTIDSVIRRYLAHLQGCLGTLHQRSAAMSSGVHVMHATITISITILWPFGLSSKAEMSIVLKY